MRKFISKKSTVVAVLSILFLAFFVSSSMESSVIVENDQIRIIGIYGERIPIKQTKHFSGLKTKE
jgi:hypothetical protein